MARPKAQVEETNNEEVTEVKSPKFVYPVYDKWEVSAKNLPRETPTSPLKVELTAVQVKRAAIKLEHNAAELLNEQSHNSLERYYEQGKVTNGDKEIVTVK